MTSNEKVVRWAMSKVGIPDTGDIDFEKSSVNFESEVKYGGYCGTCAYEYSVPALEVVVRYVSNKRPSTGTVGVQYENLGEVFDEVNAMFNV